MNTPYHTWGLQKILKRKNNKTATLNLFIYIEIGIPIMLNFPAVCNLHNFHLHSQFVFLYLSIGAVRDENLCNPLVP